MYGNQQSVYDSVAELAVSSAMANVRNKSTDELTAMLDDTAQLDAIIDSLPQVTSVSVDRDSSLARNKSLAEWNMAQQPRIDQIHSQNLKLFEEASALKAEVNEMKKRLDELSSSRSLDTTHSLMLISHQEADDDAENLTLSHLRKIKADRINAIIREQQGYGTIGSSGPPQPMTSSQGFQMPGYPNLTSYGYQAPMGGPSKHPFF
ncbi:unnamed protein product [Caenorhabditis auriculariae]|uniref:VPS37 C-terminal domain-containing protein n=1 Tax=Caenorhabditis auriculariae TaxID=2777116 RepID=A0A8S1HAJ0_9PELO|nr:unnamed protein product [Caenorhabditis auriculariae]